MAQPGGPKRGAGPNPYEHKSRCVCDRSIPQREIGGISCLKCGHMLRGQLAEPRTVLGGGSLPAQGRTHRTSGTAIRI